MAVHGLQGGKPRRKKKRLKALALEVIGGGPKTKETVISNICKAFGCTPSQALNEDPKVCFGVIESRVAYHIRNLQNSKDESWVTEMEKNPELVTFWKELTGLVKDDG